MERKFSQKVKNTKEDEHIFRKVSIGVENEMQKQENSKPIDFHLTNSFGTAALKNQMIIESKKQAVNPFEEIISEIQAP